MNPSRNARKGWSLPSRMDGMDEQELRRRLRVSKRTAPGFTHSLHHLWAAYLSLEADYLSAVKQLEEVRKAAA